MKSEKKTTEVKSEKKTTEVKSEKKTEKTSRDEQKKEAKKLEDKTLLRCLTKQELLNVLEADQTATLCSKCPAVFTDEDLTSIHKHVAPSHPLGCKKPEPKVKTETNIKPNVKHEIKPSLGSQSFQGSQPSRDSQRMGAMFLTHEELLKELSTSELEDLLLKNTEVNRCPCGLIFEDSTMFFLHRTMHSDQDPLKCRECQKRFRDFYKFTEHLFHI